MRFNSNTICLVTGGLGFIGSHFIEKALSLGWRVINVDKVSYASNSGLPFENHANYYHIKQDISELSDIPFCDVIVNFAAESHVDNSISGPFAFIKSNFLGVYNLLETLKNKKHTNISHCWSFKYPLFVQISTDEVFGDILEGAFSEDAVMRPSNPYSASKASAELLVKAWFRTYDVPFIITRTTNNYGPRQHQEKLIPMAITRCLRNLPITVHGNGSYLRNWIHVEDNVNAIMTVIQSGNFNECYNICSDEEFSVNDVVDKILQYFNLSRSNKTIDSSMDRSGVDIRYALVCDKIKNLGWQTNKTFDSTLPDLVNYYKGVLNV